MIPPPPMQARNRFSSSKGNMKNPTVINVIYAAVKSNVSINDQALALFLERSRSCSFSL